MILLPDGQMEESGGEHFSTNNRMELMAVVSVLLELTKSKYSDVDITHIEVNSDSAYVVNAVNQDWVSRWKRSNWRTKDKSEVKNHELWESLDEVLDFYKTNNIAITFTKVKGHSGDTFNELVDSLARNEVNSMKYL